MQVTVTVKQLIDAARLSRKADAAMHSGAATSSDVRAVFVGALAYNEEQADTIPELGTTDIFDNEWTAARRSEELQSHIDARSEIITLARAVGIEL